MNSSAIFMGIVPLLVFVVIDLFSTLKVALVVAAIMAIAELGLSLYLFGELDWISILSVVLILVFAFVSFRSNKSIHFKLQPALVSFLISGVLLISYIGDAPFLLSFAMKYLDQLPEQMRLMMALPEYQKLLRVATLYLGISFIFHGALTTFAAFKLSNWWWLIMRGVGFYLFSFVAMLLARFSI